MPRLSEDVWEQTLDLLRQDIGEPNVRAWLGKSRVTFPDSPDAPVSLAVPNEFFRRWINKRFRAKIEAALETAAQEPVELEIVICEDLDEGGRGRRELPAVNGTAPVQQTFFEDDAEVADDPTGSNGTARKLRGTPRAKAADATDSSPPASTDAAPFQVGAYNRLNPRYRFDEFIIGESNRYAHAAANAVADPRSNGFHPLFIYGGTGLGKTHLMQGIGHKMLKADGKVRVLYVTSEQFINHFIDSIQHRKSNDFRSYYRNVDLLLIDDVQFLMGKDRSQMEFFHTFNALCEAGKKVVVSSDRAPKDLQALEDRLRSRFEWGLLVDIQPPDLETRVAILRKKAEIERMMLPTEVAIFVAERVTSNVRELEGMLKRLRVYASLHGRSIDLALAREVLGTGTQSDASRAICPEDVQRAVCDYFQIKISDLLGKNRSKKFSRPRHMAQYLCRKLTDLSFPDIALKFGGKDHTSVIYACKKMEASARTDRQLAEALQTLEDRVLRGGN
ncbi:MAG: chromosomal replication initiator protein DnaA [Candidatus Sumerlaeia bacterium]|nr:chromosomal replication initiator protein DnaA [Candidatus Sumerlaeia bacterium]